MADGLCQLLRNRRKISRIERRQPVTADRWGECGSSGGGRPPRQAPRWSAGRRRAPEAGGLRKGIVLWRAPRPKRERVVTFARVAWPPTLAPPGAPLPRVRGVRDMLMPKLGRAGVARTGLHASLRAQAKQSRAGCDDREAPLDCFVAIAPRKDGPTTPPPGGLPRSARGRGTPG